MKIRSGTLEFMRLIDQEWQSDTVSDVDKLVDTGLVEGCLVQSLISITE